MDACAAGNSIGARRSRAVDHRQRLQSMQGVDPN